MPYTFKLAGSVKIEPNVGAPSADPTLDSLLDETVTLLRRNVQELALAAGALNVAVAMGPVTSAHALIIKTVGGGVTARLTSAAGATQVVPIDSLLILLSATQPITAIDLSSTPAVTVKVQMGQTS